MIKKTPIPFSKEDIQDLDIELKVGILGTVNPDGLPHLTMLSSLRPYSENGLVWGQFTEGLSKKFVRENPKTGFLIMSLDRQIWRGKARFTHTAQNGPEHENYNQFANVSLQCLFWDSYRLLFGFGGTIWQERHTDGAGCIRGRSNYSGAQFGESAETGNYKPLGAGIVQ